MNRITDLVLGATSPDGNSVFYPETSGILKNPEISLIHVV
jgi:hypothetical protein